MTKPADLTSPCITCGACCAHYRVSFYWGEADPEQGGLVPPELVEPVDEFFSCMKGTNRTHPRCVALVGEVGKAVHCGIYEMRSTSCREFGIHMHAGVPVASPQDLARCNQARAVYGLPALQVPAAPERQQIWTRILLDHYHRFHTHKPAVHPHGKPRSGWVMLSKRHLKQAARNLHYNQA